jgi:DNA polymerase I-like protein with 3'-5' exonuclease and polymerase domains
MTLEQRVEKFSMSLNSSQFWDDLDEADLLVLQNGKFDLMYMLKHDYENTMEFFKFGGMIWDCMQAEYLLSNQTDMFAPLGNKYKQVPVMLDGKPTGTTKAVLVRQGMAEKYGGTDKDDRIKEFWDSGIDTPKIPHDMLVEYLQDDLKNTSIVFEAQMHRVKHRGDAFTNLVKTQMEAIFATTLMEWNGMHFDIEKCGADAVVLADKYDKSGIKLREYMHDEFIVHADIDYPPIPLADMNPNSNVQVASLLYGGTYKMMYPMAVTEMDAKGVVTPVRIKSGPNKGKIKTKLTERVLTIEREHSLAGEAVPHLTLTDAGNLPVDAKAVTTIKQKTTSPVLDVFLDRLIEYRDLDKDLNTYYLGLMKLTWPTDSCIHGQINHCSTSTGRTSSSNPNMQNISG